MGVPAYHWNPEQMKMDPEALRDVTDIIHLAGATLSKRWTPKYKQVIVSSRVNGLHTIKKELTRKDQKLSSLISASGINYYPFNSDEKLVESAGRGQGFLSDVCFLWETGADQLAPFCDRIVKLRIGMVLDAKGGGLVPMMDMAKLRLLSPVGSGNQKMSWIHLEDLIRVFKYVLTTEVSGVYNAVSPETVNNTVFTRTLTSEMKITSPLPNIPDFAVKLRFGEMASLVINGMHVVPERLVSEGFNFNYPNLKEAIQEVLTH